MKKIFWFVLLVLLVYWGCTDKSSSPTDAAWDELTAVNVPADTVALKRILPDNAADTVIGILREGLLADQREISISQYALFEKNSKVRIETFFEHYCDTANLDNDKRDSLKKVAAKHPVENITWEQAALFCNWRSSQEGLSPCYDTITWQCFPERNGYRLPTEAEWLYLASRDTLAANKGSVPDPMRPSDTSGAHALWNVLMPRANSADTLMDFLGNVSEWCNDRFRTDSLVQTILDSIPVSPRCTLSLNQSSHDWNISRVYRSGINSRGSAAQNNAYSFIGFRCVRKAP